jgi:hypothetical protein
MIKERHMNHLARLILGAAMLPLASAMPAAAGLSGDYTVKLYPGPSHQHNTSICIVFTNTDNIDGFPDSGTWAEYESPSLGGNFVVDGNKLRWYGTASGTNVLNFYNRIKNDVPGSGGFDSWLVSSPPITAINDGTTRMKAGFYRCGPRKHQIQHASPPS